MGGPGGPGTGGCERSAGLVYAHNARNRVARQGVMETRVPARDCGRLGSVCFAAVGLELLVDDSWYTLDKRIHVCTNISCAICGAPTQVMGLKMLVDDSRYTLEEGGDVEGLGVADAINAHLPPQIRVFTVQKVRGDAVGARGARRGGCGCRTCAMQLWGHNSIL